MLFKMNDKVCCIIGVLVALWLFCTSCQAENSAIDQLSLHANSFDYASPTGWGFPIYCSEDDTRGLSFDQRIDLIRYPEHWLKAWVRICAQPNIHKATAPLYDTEDDMNPLFYSNMRFEHIYISNMHELGVYPKPYMVYAANPSTFLDEPLQTDGDWWYMEIIIEERGRTEEEIVQALRQAKITCDAYVQCDGQYDVKTGISVDFSTINRRIFFETNVIEVTAEQCKRSDIPVEDIFANYSVSEDLEIEARIHPEHFVCYSLQLALTNRGSYDVLNIDKWSVLCDNYAWLMYYETEFSSSIYCKSGTSIPLTGYYLILRKPEHNEKGSEKAINEMTIPIVIHTEFAGMLRVGEEEGTVGYDGLPFSIEIDMRNCM